MVVRRRPQVMGVFGPLVKEDMCRGGGEEW